MRIELKDRSDEPEQHRVYYRAADTGVTICKEEDFPGQYRWYFCDEHAEPSVALQEGTELMIDGKVITIGPVEESVDG